MTNQVLVTTRKEILGSDLYLDLVFVFNMVSACMFKKPAFLKERIWV